MTADSTSDDTGEPDPTPKPTDDDPTPTDVDADQDVTGGSAPAPRDGEGDGDGGGEGDGEGDGDGDGPQRSIAVAGTPQRPPPRRTGIFVDAEDLRTHVGGLLRAMLNGYEVDAFGNFSFTHDGARVFVTVGPTPVGLAVSVHSVTNIDLDLGADLAKFIATTNHRLGFGALSYDQENRAVWLRHTLLGTALEAPELQAAVATVARTAASLDDTISERFGGRTFDDAPADLRESASPPGPDGRDPGDDDRGPANASGYL